MSSLWGGRRSCIPACRLLHGNGIQEPGRDVMFKRFATRSLCFELLTFCLVGSPVHGYHTLHVGIKLLTINSLFVCGTSVMLKSLLVPELFYDAAFFQVPCSCACKSTTPHCSLSALTSLLELRCGCVLHMHTCPMQVKCEVPACC